MTRKKSGKFSVGRYEDSTHAEVLDDLETGEYGYRYRILDGVIMPPYITPDRYRLSQELEMRKGDVCFTAFPKSGSTWLSYIILMIAHNGEVPTDKTLRDCLQWVASSFTYPRSREELDAMPPPRIFKSHMPWHMAVGGNPLETPCRYVYISRNPKDVLVSYFFFESSKSWAGGYDGPWDHWFEMFIAGKVQRGDWFDHVLSWWEHRTAENVLFLKYEDLKNDLEQQVRALAQFMGYPLSDELLALIMEATSFDKMRRNEFSDMKEIEELGSFFRKGYIGSWREQFSEEQDERFSRLYEQRLAGTGLDFDFG